MGETNKQQSSENRDGKQSTEILLPVRTKEESIANLTNALVTRFPDVIDHEVNDPSKSVSCEERANRISKTFRFISGIRNDS